MPGRVFGETTRSARWLICGGCERFYNVLRRFRHLKSPRVSRSSSPFWRAWLIRSWTFARVEDGFASPLFRNSSRNPYGILCMCRFVAYWHGQRLFSEAWMRYLVFFGRIGAFTVHTKKPRRWVHTEQWRIYGIVASFALCLVVRESVFSHMCGRGRR